MNKNTIHKRSGALSGAALQILKKIPWILGRHAFSLMILCILLDVAFGGFLLYQNVWLPALGQSEITVTPVAFKDDIYQLVAKRLSAKKGLFTNIEEENYQDPFKDK